LSPAVLLEIPYVLSALLALPALKTWRCRRTCASFLGHLACAVASLHSPSILVRLSARFHPDCFDGGCQVPQLARRKENLDALSGLLNGVQRIAADYEAVQALFETADFVSALALIKRAQRSVATGHPPLSLSCLLSAYEPPFARRGPYA
jgi:hypothetical protein